MRDWAAASSWSGEGIRREVFFFESGGTALYGSLYASLEPSRPFGLVACGSWGVEADRSDPLVRTVALGMARLGGAAMVFHYPGYGDSHGDLAAVAVADLAAAASDAVAEAARRVPGLEWLLAGYMFGAGVACLAPVPISGLLLVQPSFHPGRYMHWLADYGKRRPFRFGVTEGMAYGYPLPAQVLDRAAEVDAAAEVALGRADATGAIVRYEVPAPEEPLPEGFELIEVPGTWRFGSTLDPKLAEAATAWLDARTKEEAG